MIASAKKMAEEKRQAKRAKDAQKFGIGGKGAGRAGVITATGTQSPPQNGANSSHANAAPSISDGINALNRTKDLAAQRAGVPVDDLGKLPPAKVNGVILKGEGYQLIPVAQIWPSEDNRQIDETSENFAELVESVKTHGVLQPIKLRPLTDGKWVLEPGTRNKEPGWFVTHRDYIARQMDRARHLNGEPYPFHPVWSEFLPPFFPTKEAAEAAVPRFEIVIGERRWRASRKAGVAQIPAIVETLDDRKAEEQRLTENLQREDLRPLDEARGYKRLQDMGLKIDEICEKVGKKKSAIYGRMKLLELQGPAAAAVEEGKLDASKAELIASIDDAGVQERLVREFQEPDWRGEAKGFRACKELAEQAAEEVAQERKWEEQTKAQREKGLKVLGVKASEKVFQYGGDYLAAGYVKPGAECPHDPQKRTWSAVLDDKSPAVIVARCKGKPSQVLPRKAAEKALAEVGVKVKKDAAQSGGRATVDYEALNRRREEERRKKMAKDGVLIAAIVAAAEARDFNAEILRVLAEADHFQDGLLLRRGFLEEGDSGWEVKEAAFKKLSKFIETADAKTLRGLLVEEQLWQHGGAIDENVQALGKAYHVDLKVQASGKGAK